MANGQEDKMNSLRNLTAESAARMTPEALMRLPLEQLRRLYMEATGDDDTSGMNREDLALGVSDEINW